MFKHVIFGTFLISTSAFCSNGLDLLIKGDQSLTGKMVVQKSNSINLDNAFLVQLYGAWRALNDNQSKIAPIVDAILAKDNNEALRLILSTTEKLNHRESDIKDASELYVLSQLKLNQMFFNRWMDLAMTPEFLNSGFAVSLDETLKDLNGKWFIESGIIISPEQSEKIRSIGNNNSHITNLVQSYNALRSGENALGFIGKLNAGDPLRAKLTDSAVLAFARAGELGKSGALLKEVYTPSLQKKSDLESLSAYHLKLGRLLYQAGAYDASEYYYSIIPKESKSFLPARTESLWISLRSNDSSKIKGDLKTLDLNIFETEFIPEVYLVSSIANLRLCQFTEVKSAFDAFLRVNKRYAREIESNIASETPKIVDDNDFYLQIAQNGLKNISTEKEIISKIDGLNGNMYTASLDSSLNLANDAVKVEARRKWLNRKAILESTIRRMRFVKIEYLSQMRRLSKMINNGAMKDSVKTIASGISKNNDFSFPHDGIFFSDELFSLSSEVKDLCLRSRK